MSGGVIVANREGQPGSQIGPAIAVANRILFIVVALAAFALYWLSSYILEQRNGTTHFAADTWFYTELVDQDVLYRVANDEDLSRIFRFHPTTVVVAAGWMKIVSPLARWIDRHYLLKAMFAAVGAIGVWAAMWGFAAVVPRRYAALWGLVYAGSLGVWYFSSIEESKIVSATFSTLYIAVYLHLRNRWTMRGAAVLTAILLLACLNEIVAGFLVIIPIVDTLVRHGWDLRKGRWVAWHILAGPIALAILEGITRGWTGAPATHAEGATHFSMLIWYISKNYFTAESLYAFAVRWLFFNIAAPELHASHWADASTNFGGDFRPVLANYLSSPVSVGLVVLFGVMLIATILSKQPSAKSQAGLMPALAAYALLRSMFFFVFNSKECLLFSSSVTLAHLLMIGIPFAASSFPAKRTLLLIFAMLLFLTNGAFITGEPRLLVYYWGSDNAG